MHIEKIVNGYGYRIQESVFLCYLSDLLRAEMIFEISKIINRLEDQCILIDMGRDPDILDNATVLGKRIVKIPKITFI